MDERITFRDMKMAFTNDQKAGKSKILFHFEELEEKPSELTFTIPNPFATRMEMITYLSMRVQQVQDNLDLLKNDPNPVVKKQKPPKKEEPIKDHVTSKKKKTTKKRGFKTKTEPSAKELASSAKELASKFPIHNPQEAESLKEEDPFEDYDD